MADFISSLIGYTPYSRKKRQIEKIRNGSKKNKKTVRIHSPHNTVLKYDLDSEEKQMKRGSPKTTNVKCGYKNNVYPCVYQETVFGSKEEWDDYILSTHDRNKSTGYRSIHEHDRLTVASLKKKGKFARRIPKEYRIYNEVTGEIYDNRLMKK
jgi:hypothetical protein